NRPGWPECPSWGAWVCGAFTCAVMTPGTRAAARRAGPRGLAPRSIAGRAESGSVDAVLHLADGPGEAHENGPADDAVADIQLGHPIEPGDRAHIPIVE